MKRRDTGLILATAFTQTVGWGTLFIPFALLLQPMERDLGWSRALLSGAFTLGLLVAGALAIPVGRFIDRHGGRLPLVGGAVLGAAALAAWALVTHPLAFYLVWAAIGVAHATALWVAAMAVVVAVARDATRTVTSITLITGFTATIFIPLVAWLEASLGWRGALWVLAAMQLSCAAVAWWQFRAAPHVPRDPGPPLPLGAIWRRPGFRGLALCLAAHSFIGTALGAHLVPLLSETGMAEGSVLLLAALHGPVQVGARALLFAAGGRLPVLLAGSVATWLLPLALLWLALSPAQVVALLPFVLFWAVSDGLLTIVRAAGTAEILGRESYGAVSGALQLLAVAPRMAGPVLLALLWEWQGGYAAAPWLLAALGLVAALAFRAAVRAAR